MSEKAWDVLREYQKQLDEEGVEVGVSRQALYETLEHVAALEQRNKELEGAINGGILLLEASMNRSAKNYLRAALSNTEGEGQ